MSKIVLPGTVSLRAALAPAVALTLVAITVPDLSLAQQPESRESLAPNTAASLVSHMRRACGGARTVALMRRAARLAGVRIDEDTLLIVGTPGACDVSAEIVDVPADPAEWAARLPHGIAVELSFLGIRSDVVEPGFYVSRLVGNLPRAGTVDAIVEFVDLDGFVAAVLPAMIEAPLDVPAEADHLTVGLLTSRAAEQFIPIGGGPCSAKLVSKEDESCQCSWCHWHCKSMDWLVDNL